MTSYLMPRNAEDHIRQLCGEALAAKTEPQLQWTIRKLRAALADYIRLNERATFEPHTRERIARLN
jgi:hypothetical protein